MVYSLEGSSFLEMAIGRGGGGGRKKGEEGRFLFMSLEGNDLSVWFGSTMDTGMLVLSECLLQRKFLRDLRRHCLLV